MTFGKHKKQAKQKENTGVFNSNLLSYQKQNFIEFSSAFK